MSWAETKMINGTLGTSNFQPLDEIIKGQWRFVISDDIYLTEQITAVHASASTYELNSYRMNASGNIQARLKLACTSGASYTINAVINGTVVASVSGSGEGTQTFKTSILNFGFSRNDVVTFEVSYVSQNHNARYGTIDLYGTPIFANNLVERV